MKLGSLPCIVVMNIFIYGKETRNDSQYELSIILIKGYLYRIYDKFLIDKIFSKNCINGVKIVQKSKMIVNKNVIWLSLQYSSDRI